MTITSAAALRDAIRLPWFTEQVATFRGWHSSSPLGFDAGDSNFYRYAFNRPVQHTDPYGLQAKDERNKDKVYYDEILGLHAAGFGDPARKKDKDFETLYKPSAALVKHLAQLEGKPGVTVKVHYVSEANGPAEAAEHAAKNANAAHQISFYFGHGPVMDANSLLLFPAAVMGGAESGLANLMRGLAPPPGAVALPHRDVLDDVKKALDPKAFAGRFTFTCCYARTYNAVIDPKNRFKAFFDQQGATTDYQHVAFWGANLKAIDDTIDDVLKMGKDMKDKKVELHLYFGEHGPKDNKVWGPLVKKYGETNFTQWKKLSGIK
jgi:hypothetical protein